MCGGNKGKSTQQTASGPPGYIQNAYQGLVQQAGNVAQTPYQPYGGELVAPVNQQQQTGINNINAASGIQNPYLSQAQSYANQGTTQINPMAFNQSNLSQYMSPYQSQVIGATMANINETNAQQQQQLEGNTIQSGAFGGDRAGVAQAELARQQGLASNQTLAGLNQANYMQGLGEFNQQQSTGIQAAQLNDQNASNAAYTFGNLGNLAQQGALAGANAQIGAGGLQQQTQQAQDTAQYQQFLNQFAYPFQTTGWLANILGGVGSTAGTQSTTVGTPAQPNPLNAIIGAGATLGAAALGKDGGAITGKAAGGGVGGAIDQQSNFGDYPYTTTSLIGNLTPMHAMGRPPQTPQMQNQNPNASNAANTQLATSLGSLGKTAGTAFSNYNDNFADPGSASSPLPGLSAADYGEARGGRINGYAGGGAPDDPNADADPGSAVRPLPGLSADDYGNIAPAPPPADTPLNYADKGSLASYIQQAAAQRGIDPQVALRVAQSEGFNKYAGDKDADGNPTSFGPMQLHYAGNGNGMGSAGLGDAFTKATGLDARDPSTTKQQIDFALDQAKSGGWGPWHGWTGDPQAGISGKPSSVAAYNDNDSTASPAPSTGAGLGSYFTNLLNNVRGNTAADPTGATNTTKSAIASPSMREAIMAAGLGMMASKSPWLGPAIGEGGQAGLGNYIQQQQINRENALATSNIGYQSGTMKISQQRVDQEGAALAATLAKLQPQLGLMGAQTQSAQAEAALHGVEANKARYTTSMTPAGMLVVDTQNPTASKLVPFSQINKGTGTNNAPTAPMAPTAPVGVNPVANATDPTTPQGQGAPTPPAGAVSPASAPAGPAQPPAKASPFQSTIDPPDETAQASPMSMSSIGADIVKTQTNDKLKAAQAGYESSQGLRMLIGQMQDATDKLPQSGLLSQGAGLTARAEMAKLGNTALQVMGINDPSTGQPMQYFDPSAIGSVEDLSKLTRRLGFDFARTLGSREAMMIVQQAVASVPGAENTPAGMQRIIGGMLGASQRQNDYNLALQRWVGKSGGDTTGFDEWFNTANPVQKYIQQARIYSEADPRDLKAGRSDPRYLKSLDKKYGAGISGWVGQ